VRRVYYLLLLEDGRLGADGRQAPSDCWWAVVVQRLASRYHHAKGRGVR